MAARSRFKAPLIVNAALFLHAAPACLSVGDPYETLSEGYTSNDRDSGEPSDVSELPERVQKNIQSALENSWIGTYRNGTFRPHEPVTREGFATLLHRVILRDAGKAPSALNETQAPAKVAQDVGIDRWSRASVESLAAWKVIRPDQNFFPEVAITREEASLWILAALEAVHDARGAEQRQGPGVPRGTKPGRLFLDADERLRSHLAALTSACPSFELASGHPALFAGNKALSRQQAAVWANSTRSCADSQSNEEQPLSQVAEKPELTQNKNGRAADFETTCDVVVNGGTLAGLSAALTAAQAGKITCLIEPLPYPAGFWLSAAEPVPLLAPPDGKQTSAILKPNQKSIFAEIASLLTDGAQRGDSAQAKTLEREPAYLRWLRAAGALNCSDQHLCFNPSAVLEHALFDQLGAQPTLFVFTQSRVSEIKLSGALISGLLLRQDTPGGSRANTKSDEAITIHITGDVNGSSRQATPEKKVGSPRSGDDAPHHLVVIEASPLGDVLVQSASGWLQGMETAGAIEPGADQCGSAFGFPAFAQVPSTALRLMHTAGDAAQEGNTGLAQRRPSRIRSGIFNGKEWSPHDIQSALTAWPLWEEKSGSSGPTRADVDRPAYFYQEKGNIYARQSYLASREETVAQSQSRSGWHGGLNQRAINHARETLEGWMRFLSATMGETVKPLMGYFPLNTPVPPLPRISTGRRGIGWKGFLIDTDSATDDVMAWVRPRKAFSGLQTCAYPQIFRSTDEAPTLVPIALRSLITERHPNLLLSGPALASDFYFNHLLTSADAQWKSGLLAGSLAVTLLDVSGNAMIIQEDPASFARQSAHLWQHLLAWSEQ